MLTEWHTDKQTSIGIGDYWVAFATGNWFVMLAGVVWGYIPGTDWYIIYS